MTANERITALEARIAQLEARLAIAEARPFQTIPNIAPMPSYPSPSYPFSPIWPTWVCGPPSESVTGTSITIGRAGYVT